MSLGALSGVNQAHAFELFGRCLIGTCETQADKDAAELIDPTTYQVALTVISDDEDVEDAVKSASELYLGRDRAVGGSAGVISRAKGDYRRILAALYNEGFYGGSISIKLGGTEASNLPVDGEFLDGSTIDITVESGPQYSFGTAQVNGAAPLTDDRNDQVPTLADVGFVPGATAEADSVGKATKLSRDAWREQGYAKARIVDQRVTANHPARELNVEIDVEPGQRATYGTVTVEGTERMDPAFVERQAELKRGEEYDPDDLDRARRRLDRLGVFSSQQIQEADDLGVDGSLPIGLIVQERKLRRIGIGATVSSLDGAGIETFWLHRNLFGKAERLRLDASIGGLGETFEYQKFDYNLGAAFTKPGVFTPDTDLSFKLFAKREFNDAFTQTSGGFSAALTQYYSESLTLNGGIFAEYGEFEEASGTSTYTTAGVFASVELDERDNKLDAKSGYFLRGEVRPFYEFNNDNFGVRSEAEARGYLAFGNQENVVLAGRLNFGSVAGLPRAQTPENLLFFAGGGGSVRGYDFNGIGVVEPDGSITGGRSKVEASAELRFRAAGNFGGVLFADAATVSTDTFPTFDEDVRVGVGAGIRYFTGLGPVRVDAAIPLNKRAGDPDFGLYAGIGQAF